MSLSTHFFVALPTLVSILPSIVPSNVPSLVELNGSDLHDSTTYEIRVQGVLIPLNETFPETVQRFRFIIPSLPSGVYSVDFTYSGDYSNGEHVSITFSTIGISLVPLIFPSYSCLRRCSSCY